MSTTVIAAATLESSVASFHRIPAFARKYKTGCSTCHTAAPKLNVLGEAFRLNGYRFPDNDALLRRDEAVPLGADPWKDLWPRAIWPGEVPGDVPLAFRVQNDIQLTRDPDADFAVSFRFPDEVYLLAGTTLGDNIAVFLETEWSRERGVELIQGKIKFQNLLPWLPERSLNLWVGMQSLYLFTFADRQIDRAARQKFLWQQFRISSLELQNPMTGDTLLSTNVFQLGQGQPAIELNGLIAGRLYYGLGLAQGATKLTGDNNSQKDVYYKVRYKFGGLSLAGQYASGGGPVVGAGGQLLDRSVIVEHFGYFGTEPVEGDRQDSHRSFGFNVRGLWGPWDIGVGYVWGNNDNPWGSTATGPVSNWSLFGKAEYLFFPWLIGSFKAETFDVGELEAFRNGGFTEGRLNQTHILPGVVLLLRQNIRGVIEADLFTEHGRSSELSAPVPQNLWFRLDVAF